MIAVRDLLVEVNERLGSGPEPDVLTLTEKKGFVRQIDRFNKRLATEDTSNYKLIRRDEIAFNPYLLWAGAVAQNTITDSGVISPLYPTFRVREGFDPKYVARLLLMPQMVKAYDTIAFGSIPRRRRSSVRDFLGIPLPQQPSLDEQRRITAVLDQADVLRAKRREALALLDDLTQSIFIEMFGSLPATRPLGGLVCGMRNGLSPSTKGTFRAQVLTLSAVTHGAFDPSAVKSGVFEHEPPAEQRVRGNDLLVCRGNGNLQLVGAGVVSESDHPDLVFPDTIIAVTLLQDVLDPFFAEVAWRQRVIRSQIEKAARTTSGIHKVSQGTLAEVLLPVPPMEDQIEFRSRIDSISEVRGRAYRALRLDYGLFASLQSRAFSGRL